MPKPLQIQYSKELAKELGKIAVYLPGEDVNVGDIITFPFGKSFFGKSRPLGSFKKISSLKNLGIPFSEPLLSNTPDTYRFSSKNSVDFNTEGNANIGSDKVKIPGGNGNLKIKFTSEGAIYFLATNCDKKELNDINYLENEINLQGKKLIWEDTYLVTSVTTAKKAFIAQSHSKSSELTINGNIEGIQSGIVDISARTSLNIQKQQGDIFIKDWSDNVTVFMDLIKFEKEVFGQKNKNFKNASNEQNEGYKIRLKQVQIKALLTE